MTGTITKRNKGTYLLRLFLGRDPESGKQLRPAKTVHGTRKEAERALREWIDQYESGRLPSAHKLTLNQYMAEWFEVGCKPRVSERTLTDYKAIYKRYIGDDIGSLSLARLSVVDIQAHYTAMRERGLSQRTIQYSHGILSQALKQAVRWRKLPFNPAADVEKPRKTRKQAPVKAMIPCQVSTFLDAAILTPHSTLFEVALTSGMRPGEYLGLGWKCVDWQAGGVRVERAAIYERNKPPYLGPPKTSESFRTIPMPPTVMKSLREHRRIQNERRLLMGGQWSNEHNLVFPNEHGGLMDYHNIARRTFKKLLDHAGLPKEFSLYSLRHTCATMLLLAGENPKVVQERLGHSSIVQTLDTYSHVLPTMQKGAADKLEGLVFGPR